MNEKEARALLVGTAQKYVGTHEGDARHAEIIRIYNAIRPLPRGFAMTTSLPWCATNVSAMASICNMLDIIPAECGCQEQVKLFQKLGCWQEDDNYTPQPGDIIYYYWKDSGVGDCTGPADHVGIVEKITGGMITLIEGNISDSVGRRTIVIGARYIRGYGLPDYAGWAARHTEEKTMDRIRTINEVPRSLRAETERLIESGALRGRGGNAGLDVTEDMLRTMIINMRYTDAAIKAAREEGV